MKKYLFFILPFLLSCEKYITNVSELSLSGKYVVSKISLQQTSQANSLDTTYLSGTTFISRDLPDPFDTIKVDDFYIHFDNSNIRMVWIDRIQNGLRDRWKYGELPNPIFYNRVPLTFDAYSFGKIQFQYRTKDLNTTKTIILNVDSDLLESLQLSGLECSPYGQNGPRYRLILSLIRVGP